MNKEINFVYFGTDLQQTDISHKCRKTSVKRESQSQTDKKLYLLVHILGGNGKGPFFNL